MLWQTTSREIDYMVFWLNESSNILLPRVKVSEKSRENIQKQWLEINWFFAVVLLFSYCIYVWIYENRAYNNHNSLGLFQDNTQAFHSMTHRQCVST